MSTSKSVSFNNLCAKSICCTTLYIKGEDGIGYVESVDGTGEGTPIKFGSNVQGDILLKGIDPGTNVNLVGSSDNKIVINAISGGVIAEPNSFFVAAEIGKDTNTGTSRADPFLTINKALTEVALAGGVNILEIMPGSYTVDNSAGALVVPENTAIYSKGGHDVTIVTASTPTNPLFTIGGGSRLSGMKLLGVTSNAVCVTNCSNDGDIHFHQIRFDLCNVGIQHSLTGGGSQGRLEVDWCEFEQCDIGVTIASSGRAQIRDTTFTNTTQDSVRPLDDTCDVDVQSCIIRDGANYGITLRNSMSVRSTTVSGCNISYCASGANLNSLIIGCTSEFAGSYDLEAQATSGVFRIVGGFLNNPAGFRALNPNNIPLLGYLYQEYPGDTTTRILGEFQVGTYFAPSESSFGGGDAHTQGMTVFSTTSGGVFTDRTDSAIQVNGITFPAFDDVNIGAALYVGGTVEFNGIKTTVTTAIDFGASATLLWEYGVNTNPVTLASEPNTWTSIGNISTNGLEYPFQLCVRNANPPYQIRVEPSSGPIARVEDLFGVVGVDQVRFGLFRYWEPTTVNGVTKYWFRVRVASAALTTVPVLDQIKLGTNRTEINRDGFREMFGNAREYKSLSWSISDVIRSTILGNPNNQTVSLTENVSVGVLDNLFKPGQRNGFGFNSFIPENVDTGLPIFVRVGFRLDGGVIDGTTKIRMPLYCKNLTRDGAVYFTTGLPTTGDFVVYPNEADTDAEGGVFTSWTIPNGTPETAVQVFTYLINTSAMRFSAAAIQDVDSLWVSLIREGDNATDNYAGNVAIFTFEGMYPACQTGKYLTSISTMFKP